MQARFKATLLRWKSKATSYTVDKRRIKAQLRRRDERIAQLEGENERLRRLTQPIGVAHHHYPIQMIAIAVFIVVQANGSLRCAAKTAAFFARLMGWDYSTPSASTVRNWTLRLGLYVLDHAEAKIGRYIGIIDESIQIGCEKALLLLGVKLREDQSHFAPLTMQDVEVLGVEVQKSWKGEQVADFLTRRMAHHKAIQLLYMVSDQGNNLLAALTKLGIHSVMDCSHVLMNGLKKLLAEDKLLAKLTAFMGNFRRQHLLSERSYLTPPTLRDKDRFLRIFLILEWIERIDTCWAQLPAAHRRTLRFLRSKTIRALLTMLDQLRAIIVLATSVLKTSGINEASRQAWRTGLEKYRSGRTLSDEAQKLIVLVEDYFDRHEIYLKAHDRLLCCSDIIESIFGRYKNKGGMEAISADVLTIALYTRPIDVQFVQQGLNTVSQPMIEAWHHSYTCENRYSTLRQLKPLAKKRLEKTLTN